MAEYGVVMKEFKRMCKWEGEWNCSTKTGCPMYPSCNIGQCRRIAFERPAEFEGRVLRWAAEHPEPVYPTWVDYVTIKMLEDITNRNDTTPQTLGTWMNKTHIPADIAQKLGLKPKEG